MNKPSFQEDHASQVPALQLLQNLGFTYLRPAEVFYERKGRLANVLLETILAAQLRKRAFTHRGTERSFSEGNIQSAILALKDLPFDGLVRTSEKIYDLLVLGKAMQETIEVEPGVTDTKSFTLNYIDWRNPANNVFHVVEEFEVERSGSKATCRPDIVLFVNGIPLCVIECKRSDMKDPLTQAMSQHIRNQSDDHIPKLFVFSQLLLAVAANDAAYATTGTAAAFWAKWRELDDVTKEIQALVNRPLSRAQKDRLFAERYSATSAIISTIWMRKAAP